MVYVFLAEGFEEVEAFTPIDYLRRCEEIELLTVGVGGKLINSSHGITVIPDITVFDVDMSKADMIILPGGLPGTLNLEKSPEVQGAVDYCIEHNKPIGAICAAPSILGHKGILKGKRACCASGYEAELLGADVTQDAVVVDGNIITARGAGVSNQFAFALIEKLLGSLRAQKIKESVRWVE